MSSELEFLYSVNSAFIEELYSQYLQDPSSVSKEWQEFFFDLKDKKTSISPSWVKKENQIISLSRSLREQIIRDPELSLPQTPSVSDAFYRQKGHLYANINPLSEANVSRETLPDDSKLKEVYCGTVGYEFAHLDDEQQINWLSSRIESFDNAKEFSAEAKKEIVDTLLKVESFEQFLHTRFTGAKRFSVEGGENSIVALRQIINTAASLGIKEIVLGMAHRGRLSTLTNILEKPYESMFSEFQGNLAFPDGMVDISGDVKYHLGFSKDVETFGGGKVHLSLTPNPSHLEAVNPVVAGRVRAKQDLCGDTNRTKIMGVLVHGDASFAGQGVVMESLMLSNLEGYDVGGIVHVVINNQVGFTACPAETSGNRYATEVAKITKMPIFHVNGNDAEQVAKVSKIAMEYKNAFKKDVLIDVLCYRLHGHNEIDEPRFTQPLMYEKIAKLDTPGKIYADYLASKGVVEKDYYKNFTAEFKNKLDGDLAKSKEFKPAKADWCEGAWKGFEQYSQEKDSSKQTGVDIELLKKIGAKITETPSGFEAHKTIVRGFHGRLEAISSGKNIDWSTAEALAFGALLLENYKVRLSGQDCGRGTFSQRQSVIVDQKTGDKYVPLNNIEDKQAKFEVINSILSEYSVMGFEYGYSTADPNSLVLWEGQFGDFSNGAQIIIDQFIASAETKWLKMSGLVLLLPHGYEGQGPEHSSGRLERYLQLCAQNNMQVINCTLPSNYFHALRRQLHRKYRKPLVIMTPKYLLRHKLAVSNISEFATGTSFSPVIDDVVSAEGVTKVVICSGKVYYDLLEAREAAKKTNIALIRLEQYYPFPDKALGAVLKKYKGAKAFHWCQEEPRNMGAWSFVKERIENLGIKLHYIGRDAAASTAAGYMKMHNAEQAKLIKEAIDN